MFLDAYMYKHMDGQDPHQLQDDSSFGEEGRKMWLGRGTK